MPIQNTGSDIRLRGDAADSVTDINEEINGNATDSDVSLGTLNTSAFTNVSDGSVITGRAMSEMQGYSTFTSALPQTEADGALGESLYFNASDEIVYLDRDADFTNTNTTGTFSFWIKRNTIDNANNTIYTSGDDQTNRLWLRWGTSGSVLDSKLQIVATTSSSTKIQLVYDYPFIDASSWYHIVVAIDTTKSYQYDRVRTYVNGIEITEIDDSVKTEIWPSQNDAIKFNNNQRIGDTTWATGYANNMVIADFKFIDGIQLRPDSFGELLQGIWIPKAFNTPSTDTLVTSGLIARYEFNGNANDTSGSATTYNGTATSVDFLSNNYGIAKFDGSSSGVTATRSWSSNSAYTIGFWFYLEPGATSGGSFVWQDGGTNQTAVFINYYGSGNTFQFLINHKGTTNTGNQIPYLFEPDGKWHYYVATFSGTSGNLYVDGQKVVGPFDLSPKTDVNSSLYLGGIYRYNNVTYRIPSTTGDIQIYSTNLSDAEILQNYNAEKHKYAYGLNGFWLPLNNTSIGNIDSSSNLKLHLDASNNTSYTGSGTNWNDLTTNNNDGTISGASFLSSTNGGVFDFDGSNDRVSLTNSLNSSTKAFEIWLNPDNFSADQWPFQQGNGQGVENYLRIYSSGVQVRMGNQTLTHSYTTANKWIHVVGTQKSGNGFEFYFNGVLVQETTNSLSSLSNDYFNLGVRYNAGYQGYFNGQIAQVRIYDKVLTAQEVITNYRATQGNYEQVSTVDISGNANSFTATNIDYTDHVKDQPLENYATFDPNLESTGGSLSEGNLKVVSSADTFIANMSFSSGKWYAEFTINSAGNAYVAIFGTDYINPNLGGSWASNGAIAYRQNGQQYSLAKGGTSVSASYGLSYTTNDIIGVEVDVDGDTIEFYKNGVSQGQTTNGLSYIGMSQYSFAAYGNTSTITANFGQKPWTYTPSTGFKALATHNLPAPKFDPDGVTPDKPSNYFKAVTYQGDGSAQGEAYGYKEGSRAAVFNGSSSYITTSLDFNTLTNYSISLWIYIQATPSVSDIFAGTIQDSGALNGFYLSVQTDRTIRFFERNSSTNASALTSTDTINAGSWNHILVVRNGSTNLLYINNGTAASTSNGTITHAEDFTIGRGGAHTSGLFEGKIDQVRIFDKALSSTEVGYLADDDTTNIDAISNQVAHYDMEGDANEANTPVGSIDSGQSAVFNGSSNIIKSTGLGVAYRNQTTLSLSYWVKSSGGSTSTGINTTVSFSDANDGSTDLFMYFRNSESKHLIVQNRNNSTTNFYFNTNFVIADGNWHHVGFVADSNGHSIYIDGNQITPTYTTGSASTQITMPNDLTQFNIGGNQDSGGNQWFANATIDQVRVYSSALSSSDITALSKETNVPTTNLDAHYKLDGNGNDATGNYNATSVSVSSYTSPAQHLSGYNGTASNVTYTQDKPYGNIDVGFAPDLVWWKNRDITAWHQLHDSIRGAGNRIFSNDASATQYDAQSITSFDSNGFSIGTSSDFNGDCVAWCWKANDTTVTDSSTGDITADIRANQDAGFSIVKYTGNSSTNQTIPHGLSSAPELIIIKNLDDSTANWLVAGENINYYLNLNRDEPDPSSTSYNWITNRGANTFTVGSQRKEINQPNEDFIAYCFHSVDGMSKIGSYIGNGSTDGPFIYTGFKPAFVLIKNVDNAYNWYIRDNVRNTSNPVDSTLASNTSSVEDNGWSDGFNFLSNGFKVNLSSVETNQNGNEFIYMAFAEDPVKYSNGVATLGDGNEFIQDANYPEDNFAATTYTGNGGTQSISTLNFQPDLTWIKNRTTTGYEHFWWDSVRGAGGNKDINSDSTNYEGQENTSAYGYLSSFDSNGFALTSGTTSAVTVNRNSDNYVAWSWKAAGHEYKSAAFNGSSSRIQLPSQVSVATGNNNFSLSAWVYLNSMPSSNASVITTQNNYYFYILIGSDGSVKTYNQNIQVNSAAGVITTGQWYHIVATLDSTSGKNVYVNGNNVATSSNTSNCNSFTSGHNAVGYYTSNGSTFQYYLDGKIDQVRIFNKALSPSELPTVYNETKNTVNTLQVLGDTSCIATYRLNGNAIDLSGNYNGTETNVDYNKGSHFAYNIYQNKARTFSHKASDLSLNTGTITPSAINANRDNGFSISKFTIPSSGSSVTVAHGLSSVPQLLIVKTTEKTGSWFVYTETTGAGKEAYLELPNIWGTDINRWDNTAPTSSVFTLGSSWLNSTYSGAAIAYCWHSVPGFSKIGSYVGNGSTNGPVIHLGFEAAFIMTKPATIADNWSIWDNKRDPGNPNDQILVPNNSGAESSNNFGRYDININSDNFQILRTDAQINSNNQTYIYMAFAHR